MEIVSEMKIEMTHQIFVVIVLYFTILNRTGFKTIVDKEQKNVFAAPGPFGPRSRTVRGQGSTLSFSSAGHFEFEF